MRPVASIPNTAWKTFGTSFQTYEFFLWSWLLNVRVSETLHVYIDQISNVSMVEVCADYMFYSAARQKSHRHRLDSTINSKGLLILIE